MDTMTNGNESPEALAKKLMPGAALQMAMHNEMARVGDARIYAVPHGWEREQLQTLAMLTHAKTGAQLEALLRVSATRAVYIPEESALTMALVCDIARRTAANIPIFMERAA